MIIIMIIPKPSFRIQQQQLISFKSSQFLFEFTSNSKELVMTCMQMTATTITGPFNWADTNNIVICNTQQLGQVKL